LAQACRALGDDIGEQNALQKLIELDSHKATAADRLLTLSTKLNLIHETSPKEAKREVLKALEINPRFEEALELLIKLQSTK